MRGREGAVKRSKKSKRGREKIQKRIDEKKITVSSVEDCREKNTREEDR